MSACPPEETLLAFCRGELTRARLSPLDAHLDGCGACRALIATMTGAPTVPRSLAPTKLTAAGRASRVVTPRLQQGTVVAGRYRVVDFVGRGGMGEVYEVEDSLLHERVGLKILAASLAMDPRANRRLKREVLLARRVTHPNVCRLFDLGQDGDLLFLTMELLRGEALGRRLRATGRLPITRERTVAAQMCQALEAAHKVKVIHRDFKSDNVLLVPDDGAAESMDHRVVVTDFGLARAATASISTGESSTTLRGAFVGTPTHAAPEQLLGQPITRAVDIYALGVVLYEMVTGGLLPFPVSSPAEGIHLRLRKAAPAPRLVAPALDPHWDAAILRCLERDPEARFPSVGALADALSL